MANQQEIEYVVWLLDAHRDELRSAIVTTEAAAKEKGLAMVVAAERDGYTNVRYEIDRLI